MRPVIFEQRELVPPRDRAVPAYLWHQWRKLRARIFAHMVEYFGEGLPLAMTNIASWEEHSRDYPGVRGIDQWPPEESGLEITIVVRVIPRERGDDDPDRHAAWFA